MRRKIVQQGPSTMMVSLPAKWVKDNHLSKGDELGCTADKGSITFSQGETTKRRKEVEMRVDNMEYTMLGRKLQVLYRAGIDKIVVSYSTKAIRYEKKKKEVDIQVAINKFVNRMMGAEVIAQDRKRTEVVFFESSDPMEIHKIEQRIAFLLKETFQDLIDAIGPKFAVFHETSYDRHDKITKFIGYLLRELEMSSLPPTHKKTAYAFYSTIDDLVDKIRHLSERIHDVGCSPKVKKYLKRIFVFFIDAFSTLRKEGITNTIVQKRYEIKKDIANDSLTVKEMRVIAEAKPFLDTMAIFADYMFAKSLNV